MYDFDRNGTMNFEGKLLQLLLLLFVCVFGVQFEVERVQLVSAGFGVVSNPFLVIF